MSNTDTSLMAILGGILFHFLVFYPFHSSKKSKKSSIRLLSEKKKLAKSGKKIVDEVVAEYLREIMKGELEWSVIVVTASEKILSKMHPLAGMELTGSGVYNNFLQKAALTVLKKLLEDRKILAVSETSGVRTEIWDFDPEDVADILEKNWQRYAHPTDLPGDDVVFFILRERLYLLEQKHAKPIITIDNRFSLGVKRYQQG